MGGPAGVVGGVGGGARGGKNIWLGVGVGGGWGGGGVGGGGVGGEKHEEISPRELAAEGPNRTLKMALAQCICNSWFSQLRFWTRSSIMPSV